LNHDYFTNRQDRYILFENTPSLTNYFADLVETIASFSYTLKPIDEDSFKLALTKQPDPVTQSNLFRKSSSLIMKSFIDKWMRHCNERINNLSNAIPLQKFDTVIFPVIQMGPLCIRQDEFATFTVLDAISRQGNNEDMFWRVFFTSGYFNFTQKYKEKILNAMTKFQLLAASPEVFCIDLFFLSV